MIKKTIKSFFHAWKGIRHAYVYEQSFRMEVWSGLILVGIGYLLWPLQEIELLFLFLSYFLILSFELVNTALERMFQRLHPEHHELVGLSKDLAASAVLVSVFFSGVVIAIILAYRFLL